MQILPPLYLDSENNWSAEVVKAWEEAYFTLLSCGCPVAVSTTFRLSRLNMLLSWPVEEGVGVVVGDCGERLWSCWRAPLRPNQWKQLRQVTFFTSDERVSESHTSPPPKLSSNFHTASNRMLDGSLGQGYVGSHLRETVPAVSLEGSQTIFFSEAWSSGSLKPVCHNVVNLSLSLKPIRDLGCPGDVYCPGWNNHCYWSL